MDETTNLPNPSKSNQISNAQEKIESNLPPKPKIRKQSNIIKLLTWITIIADLIAFFFIIFMSLLLPFNRFNIEISVVILFLVPFLVNFSFLLYVILQIIYFRFISPQKFNYSEAFKNILRLLITVIIVIVLLFFTSFIAKFLRPLDTIDKPVIYLYPTQKQKMSVQLHYDGKITDTYPLIDLATQTWDITAYPNGHLINTMDKHEYSYLFWEGVDTISYDLSTGFVVKGENTATFLQNQLAAMGLNPKEYNEFIVYWLPKMQHNPYNLIHFAQKDYTDHAKLDISPKPESLLRVFMVFKSLQNPVALAPQTFPKFERNGFTVIEWGGTELNNF